MHNFKPLPTPMVSSLQLTSDGSTTIFDPSFYRSIVGGLQYITITRPELAYSSNKIYQYMPKPVKRILRYLQGTIDYGLYFKKSLHLILPAFSDSDQRFDPNDRKFIVGFCVYLGDNLISWCTRKQRVVSCSSIEVEFRSVAAITLELLWLQSLLSELKVPSTIPKAYCDSLGMIMLVANPIMHSRSKHFKLNLYFVRDKVIKGVVQVIHLLAQFLGC
uniref:Copia protein n=1 Tax=Cajanus cajan TaxID=3821 RepID=A0A151T6Q5_CAJCA|nr:hypothetical protein KK1_017271 [Cajanus cajan]